MNHNTLLLLGALTLSACSKGYEDASDTEGWDSGRSDADADTDSDSDSDTDLPSETESDFLKLSPASTDLYVFVVNSARNTVSRISVPSLDVLTTDVGVDPRVALTTSDYGRAVIFNAGSDTLSVIDAMSMVVTEVEIRSNFNNMVLSPDGRWALVYHDADLPSEGGSGGLQSFNEISLVDTLSGEHFGMAVGFHPRQVAFTPDSSQVLIVADAWMASLDLSAEEIAPKLIALTDDFLNTPKAEEVVIEPTGAYAFVRQFGQDELIVVDLLSHEIERVGIGYNPTDLDLSPDGTQAVVVSRGSQELHVLEAQRPYEPQRVIQLPEDEVLGSLQFSPDGTQAILYTTASPVAHYTTWDLSDDSLVVRKLEKPIASVSVSPTGGTALIFHTLEDDPDTPSSSAFYGEHALTMVDLDSFLANPLLLPSDPSAFATSEDGAYGFFIMEGVPALAVLQFDYLLFDEIILRSDPVHLGVLPLSTYAYVNQEHPLGRLSFYEPSGGDLQTITGFELNNGIEH